MSSNTWPGGYRHAIDQLPSPIQSIATDYGVSRETVRDIKNKRYWRHIHV